MARRRRNTEEPDAPAEWLLTYSDLVTLLLTFFVMLYSMSVLDKQKFQQLSHSLRSTFLNINAGEIYNYNRGEDIFNITPYDNADNENQFKSNNEQFDEMSQEELEELQKLSDIKLKNVKKQLEEAIEKHNLAEYVRVVDEKRSLILRFDSVVLFDLGRAEIRESGKEILKELGTILKELDNDITIEGHTDNLPINTLLFPSNWELSTKRATNVVIFLIENCGLKPEKLTAAGRGEYEPVAPNDSDENRQKNRRIDIVVDKYIID